MITTIGDNRIQAGGLYDESDGFDAPPGTMNPSSSNVVPNRNLYSWLTRGGFSKDLDMPTTSNGMNTGMTFVKQLHTKKFTVSRPVDKLMTFMASVVSFVPVNGSTVYMLRFFMSPSYTGSNTALYPASGNLFGSPTSWQDKTPYYIDIVEQNKTIIQVTPTNYYCPIAAPSNGGYHQYDLDQMYVYVEDDVNFTVPYFHNAEGDRCAAGANTYFDAYTNNVYFPSANMDATDIQKINQNFVRFHKNLETGRINYTDLCSTVSAFFDDYTISSQELDEGLLVSVHPGTTGRAAFTFYLSYQNKVSFDTTKYVANIWSVIDRHRSAGLEDVFDRRLVYGFPNYSNINKSDNAAVFNGKTINVYTGGPSAGAAQTDTIINGSYNKYKGYFQATAPWAAATDAYTGQLYQLVNCDVKIIANDFFFQEFDVHGRIGEFYDFKGHTKKLSSFARLTNFMWKFNNYLEQTVYSIDAFDGLTTSDPVFSPASGGILAITIKTAGTYTTAAGTFDLDLPGNAKATYTLVANAVSSVSLKSSGWGYFEPPTAKALHGTPTVEATFNVTLSKSLNSGWAGLCGVHSGYRYGLQSTKGIVTNVGTVAGTHVSYGKLAFAYKLPCHFNRTITGILTLLHMPTEAFSLAHQNPYDVLQSRGIVNDDLQTGWDFRLAELDGTGSGTGVLKEDGYFYSKFTIIDKNDYDKKNLSGDVLTLTGNPAISSAQLTGNSKVGVILSDTYKAAYGDTTQEMYESSVMVQDVSFGARSMAIARDRLFAADVVFQEFQIGALQSTQVINSNTTFFSPIGQYGGNFHLYNAGALQAQAKNIGKTVAVLSVSMPQSLDVSTQPNRNNLLILGEEQTVYLDLRDNNAGEFVPVFVGNDGCVSRNSAITQGGIAFYAGNRGVYMFQGQEQIDITELGDSKINKTWRAIPRATKQLAVGAFNRDRKQYWLGVGGTIYVFDLSLERIYTYDVSAAFSFDKFSDMQFIQERLYLSVTGVGARALSYYDEAVSTDWNGSANVNFASRLKLNPIKATARMAKMQNFSVTYRRTGAGTFTLSPLVDDVAYIAYLTEATIASNVFIERHVRPLAFTPPGNSRGRRFAMDFQLTTGIMEIKDINLGIIENIPQKSLIRGYTNG